MTLPTYSATLFNGQIEWNTGQTPSLPKDRPVRVQVTVLEPPDNLTPEERGRRMAEILGELAAMNAFRDIEDPVAWQREIRKDRDLPGRSE